jgi:hypothetical protein
MKYILEFKNWASAVKEGFDAKIEDTKKIKQEEEKENSIKVVSPTDGGLITYNIKGSKITSKRKEAKVDDNGRAINIPNDQTEEVVTDEQLKDDIKKAAIFIDGVKDRIRRAEVLRITGGDITDATDKISEILNKFIDEVDTENENEKGVAYTLGDTLLSEEGYHYIPIPIDTGNGIGQYKLTYADIKDIYVTNSHTIGKGEYLLPFIFNDVHKRKAYGVTAKGDNAKGDNFIKTDKGIINIEVKGRGAHLSFETKDIISKISDSVDNKELTDDEKKNITIEVLKNEIAKSFAQYIHKQLSLGETYLCMFDATKYEPKGMFFIKDTIITEENPKMFIDLLEIHRPHRKGVKSFIVDEFNRAGKGDFTYTFTFIDGEPKIMCALSNEVYNKFPFLINNSNDNKKQTLKKRDDSILSRDEFTKHNDTHKKEVY